MSGTQPVALYAAKVPPGGILVPAVPNASAMFRVTMAAIDPDAMPEFEDEDHANKPPRATLKIVRPPPGLDLGDDEDESSDEEEDSSDEEENGGPSDPAKQKKAKLAAALREMEDDMDEDEDEDDEDGEMSEDALTAAISKLIKGKGKASDDGSSDTSDDLELEEVVVCTLDTEKTYQQNLDFVVAEDERVFFKVTGTHTVYLTGNYVIPTEEENDDDSEDEEEDYDMSPDEDELALLDDGDESDSLDDLENPRVMEIDTDEEEAPQTKKSAKGKNKRPASELTEGSNLDDMMSKALKSDEAATEPKLSKKQQKKLKKNNGEAVEAAPSKEAATGKSEKKVQFAKNLEQGPTRKADAKPDAKAAGTTGTLGQREVQGVTIDDRKLGEGRAAKKGDTVSMRYIGKLESGKVFDSNKKGKPFSFKLGSGEVIKGWDIGVPGMAIGGERRVSVPPHHAYGRKALPGIPANSKLIFDVKLLGIK